MNLSLYQAAAALNVQNRWQDVVADNLAASSVPGFKKQELTVAAVQAGLLPASSATGGGQPTAFLMPRATVSTSFTPGEMRFTGVNTDLAVDGKAFFEVQLPDGRLGYTRDGEFHVDTQGRIVTKHGYPVLGQNGPIQLDPNLGGPLPETVNISADGQVSQGAEARDQLRLVEFSDPRLLTPAPGGFFVADNPALQPNDAGSSTVRQRWLEMANASPMTEMATLMASMRSFEANQRIVQIQDERMGKVISELSNA